MIEALQNKSGESLSLKTRANLFKKFSESLNLKTSAKLKKEWANPSVQPPSYHLMVALKYFGWVFLPDVTITWERGGELGIEHHFAKQ